MEKRGPDGPKWGQEDFVLLIQTLPTFWATWILILIIFMIWIFRIPNLWISRSPDLQIPRFPDAAGAGGRILRSQPDPSPNAPRDQIRRKGPCCDLSGPWNKCQNLYQARLTVFVLSPYQSGVQPVEAGHMFILVVIVFSRLVFYSDFAFLDVQIPRFLDFRADPILTPLPTHSEIKFVAEPLLRLN